MGTTSFDQFDVRQRPNRIRPQLAEILQMLGGSKRRHHKQTLAGLTESAGLGFFGLGVHSEWRGFNANCDSEVIETEIVQFISIPQLLAIMMARTTSLCASANGSVSSHSAVLHFSFRRFLLPSVKSGPAVTACPQGSPERKGQRGR